MKFHIGKVLSVVGDRLIAPNQITGVYEIMDFLSGASLFTHQLLIYRDACRAELLRQHPQLADWDDSEVRRDNWGIHVQRAIEKYGAYLEISPIPGGLQIADPISDLGKVGVPKEKIIVLLKG